MSRRKKPASSGPVSARFAATRIAHSLGQAQSEGSASLTRLLPQWNARTDPAERSLLMEISYGVARWSGRLDALLAQLLDKPLRNKDQDVHALLKIGLYQLAYMRVPEHAVVNTTVSVTAELGKPWAKGLVNAVLRNYQRSAPEFEAGVTGAAAFALPEWLFVQFRHDWPEHWQEISNGANKRAPMTLRINRQRTSRAAYLTQLVEQGIASSASDWLNDAVTLAEPCPVNQLPDFSGGSASVQDESAQIAAHLLNIQPGEKILDACAAPGGKTCHLLECNTSASVLALDNDADRLLRVEANAQRLQVEDNLQTLCADAADSQQWWDGQAFDAVLLDAPCSGTGVLRRHPDIKLLRRPSDIQALVEQQRRLLDSLWQVLRPGGRLLYATCSQLKAENEQQIENFLADTTDAQLSPLDDLWPVNRSGQRQPGIERPFGRQILCDGSAGDGFFYSLLGKSHDQG